MSRTRPLRTTAVSVITAIVAALLSGGGWALAAPATGVIHGCASRTTGALRLAKSCRRGEVAVTWNVRGPIGPAGPSAAASHPTPSGTAGGALAGSYPDPTLNITGGDNGGTACKNGEGLTGFSAAGVLTCGTGVYTDGFYNVAVVPGAWPNLQPVAGGFGTRNTALGVGALTADTIGFDNTAVGLDAMADATNGGLNTGVGANALQDDANRGSTAVGAQALESLPLGGNDVAIGSGAGDDLTGSESWDIDLGSPGVTGDQGVIRIGGGNQTSAFLAGVSGASIAGPDNDVLVNSSGQLGTATASLSSEKMDIEPLSALAPSVLRLHPVSYRYRAQYAAAFNPTQYGLIAQQVERVLPALVQYGRNGRPTGVYYQELPALLLAEIQHQQHQIDRLESENRRIDELQADVDALMRHRGGG